MAGPWSATTTYQIARGDTNRRVAITALLADTLYDIDISSSATFEEADTMRLVIDTQDLPIPALSALTGKAATTGTIRLVATLTHNDTAETVYFRHRADGTTAWTSAGSVTVGAPTVLVARSITGLARGTTYEIQASLAADYSTPTTVTVPLLFNFDPLATANTDPSDLWGDNTHLYVLDRNGEALYAYHLATKAHDASRSIDLSAEFPPGSTPVGAWGDDTTLWVLSTNGNIEAYTFATLAHEPANTITLAALSGAPSAMHVHGDKLYVAVIRIHRRVLMARRSPTLAAAHREGPQRAGPVDTPGRRCCVCAVESVVALRGVGILAGAHHLRQPRRRQGLDPAHDRH